MSTIFFINLRAAMDTFLYIFLNNSLPVFLLIGLGFLLERSFCLDITTLTKITFYAVVPALAFVSLINTDIPADLGFIVLFSLALLFMQYLTARIVAMPASFPQSKAAVLANSLMFFNSGNMGLPLIMLTFRDSQFLGTAITIQITVMIIQTIFSQTLGFYIAEAGKAANTWKKSIQNVMKMPIIYSVVVAVLLKKSTIDITELFLWTSVEYLHDMLIGISLLTLGIHLAKTGLRFDIRGMFIPTFLRLIGGPLLAYGLAVLFKFDQFTTSVLVLSSAMPTAINIALISIESDTSPRYASQIVVSTTVLSILTIPLIIILAV
jgi:predicted permease